MQPASLETNIIYQCGRFTHIFHQTLTQEFKRSRIRATVEQFSILAVLFYKDGINQKEVGALLNRDKTTIARIISNMVRNRMISRINDPADNRGKLIYLTKKGRGIQTKAVRLSGKLYHKAIANIKEHDLKNGQHLIMKMTANIFPGT
jgi:MarR family transcriptional regulator, organic hydroperoxide resistance regulator